MKALKILQLARQARLLVPHPAHSRLTRHPALRGTHAERRRSARGRDARILLLAGEGEQQRPRRLLPREVRQKARGRTPRHGDLRQLPHTLCHARRGACQKALSQVNY